MPTPTLQQLKNEIAKAGFTASNASWESDTNIYAFSVEEAGRGPYAGPKFTATFNKSTGYMRIGNAPAILIAK